MIRDNIDKVNDAAETMRMAARGEVAMKQVFTDLADALDAIANDMHGHAGTEER